MLSKVYRQRTKANRLIRLVLVFALLFAALHVSLHAPDLRGERGEQCEVCSLNHVPVVSFVPPSLLAPQQTLAYVFPVVDSGYQPSHRFHVQPARGPPLV